MTPYLQDADVTLYHGDVLDVLREIADESVDCCVTSPPYWGLRDYGTGAWEGGDEGCDHKAPPTGGPNPERYTPGGGEMFRAANDKLEQGACRKCGATRTDQQLGLEPTPEEYVARMVEVFREVRRVLASHGTVWLNLGDSYNAGRSGGWAGGKGALNEGRDLDAIYQNRSGPNVHGLKPKDLVGIPWLVARALQEPYYTGRIKRERDRVWLAATIDGEGTICGTVHTRKDTGATRTMPQVFITNSSMAMLDEAQRIWPTSQSDHYRPGDGHLGELPTYRWIVHGIENKTAIVQELYPYLIVKRTQALLAYNLLVLMADAKRLGKSSQAQAVRDKREHVCRLMSELNHAQNVDVPSWCVEPPSLYEPGWYLRSDIIWAKPNPMPESVTDRPTKAHEYVFLLSKSPRYFFDAEAVREPATMTPQNRYTSGENWKNGGGLHRRPDGATNPSGRNIRSVWEIATQPYPEAHFATFPEELARRCIAAGCPEQVCRVCSKARERIVEASGGTIGNSWHEHEADGVHGQRSPNTLRNSQDGSYRRESVGFTDCGHGDFGGRVDTFRPGIVLDPFAGSGTTMHVARKLGRHSVGIDLSAEYLALAAKRLQQQSLFAELV